MNASRLRAALAALIMVTPLIMWQPTVAQAAEREACTLQPSGHAEGNEWLSCLRVNAELDRLPATGQEATLTFEVTSQIEQSGLSVEAELPSNMDWVSPPQGFEPRNPHLAIATISLGAQETRRFAGTVRATGPGGAHLAVRATAPPRLDPEDGRVLGQDAADDHQYLTVAEAGGRSTPGLGLRPEGEAAASTSTTEPTLATPDLEPNPIPGTQSASIMSPGQFSCVSGSFGYLDGTNKLSPNVTVEVWDSDFWDANDLLITGLTNALGAYNICFATDDMDGPFADAGQDVYVVFVTTNNRWRLQETGTGNLYKWASPIKSNLAANVTHNFGYLQPGNPNHHLGMQAFDAANDFWNWHPGSCWDSNDTAANCKQVVINWAPDSQIGTQYDGVVKAVFLMGPAPKARKTVVHEVAHAVMDDVYEGTPIPGGGGFHDVYLPSNVGMAWTEGFAEWVPAMVYNSPSFQYPSLVTIDLEGPKWGELGWGTGDTTEGRVAGALIDISDNTNENPWDRLNEGNGPGNIWKTFLGPIATTRVQYKFKDFWDHRGLDGFNVTAAAGLSTLYQNTIDYKFRDPIANYTPQLRPHPIVPHHFSFSTTSFYWSVIANRPSPGVDNTLRLYEDVDLNTLLASSAAAGTAVDFIAIDSNKKALTDYYPQVSAVSGAGDCRVELAQSSLSLAANASQTVTMGTNSVVAVRDTFISGGATVTIKVTPGVATQDPELFLMRSVSGQTPTYVRSRAQATKASTAAGPGAVESFVFVAPVSDWYGIVIINKAGSGNYTLQRIG